MFNKKPVSVAQFMDQFILCTMFCVSLMAMSYAFAAGVHIVDVTLQSYMEWGRVGFGITAAVVMFPMFVKLISLKEKCPDEFAGEFGYMQTIATKAGERAFSFTFVFMILLEPLALNMFHHMPPAFFLEASIAFSLAVLVISFYFYNRGGDDDLDDTEAGQG